MSYPPNTGQAQQAIMRNRQPHEPVSSGLSADAGLVLGRSRPPALPRIEIQRGFRLQSCSPFSGTERTDTEKDDGETTGDEEDILHGKVMLSSMSWGLNFDTLYSSV
jgi:hypothetical protein